MLRVVGTLQVWRKFAKGTGSQANAALLVVQISIDRMLQCDEKRRTVLLRGTVVVSTLKFPSKGR